MPLYDKTYLGNLLAERAAATDTAVASKVTGDSVNRVNQKADGETDYGPGDGVADLTTKRAAAGVFSVTKLGVGNSAAATTPGSVAKKIEVFDDAGASLGFIAVYDGIS